ncbi:hypothetical protein QBC46DRAFT_382584 [Diplogelasinospora grovesii]|uniref:Uncharacterized protein n=1 Tax=Diplogelasinospora grovesii TaxID=303347 RepID=A0AAN6NCT0_9PEZI|nr:hypothetical protein QBC46DRAFT_382584 [Diplogelasinospora grovesii]
MFFSKLINLLPLLAAVGGATAAKRDIAANTGSNITVYAYGTGISGLPVYAGTDGLAYVSTNPSSDMKPVNWTLARGGQVPWNVTLGSSNSTSTSAIQFYIVTTADAFEPVGFLNSTSTAPDGAVTTGFTTYGSNVMYIDGSTYTSQFWAMSTTETGVWEIMWNESGADQAGSVPVALRTVGPPTIN